MTNYGQTLLAQYANSPTISALVAFMDQWVSPHNDLDNFYNTVWNIQTASGFGLDTWGQIVNVSRIVRIPTGGVFLGFKGTGENPFGQSPMFNGNNNSGNITLPDSTYRQLIYVKAMANITNCSIPQLNGMLQFLFPGRGMCFVQDTGDMTLRYCFEFPLTQLELSMLCYSGALPRPAGVLACVVQLTPGTYFGFSGSDGVPFGQLPMFNQNQISYAID